MRVVLLIINKNNIYFNHLIILLTLFVILLAISLCLFLQLS